MAVNLPAAGEFARRPSILNRAWNQLFTQSGLNADGSNFSGFVGAYPIQAGEVGVVNTQYPRHHLLRYGSSIAYGTQQLQNAIDSATPGAAITCPVMDINLTAQVNLNKKLIFNAASVGEGGGTSIVVGTRILGTGFTLLLMTEPCIFNGLTIQDPVGNAATIAVDINDGANGVTKWAFNDCYILAPHTVKLGTGVRCIFALEGKFNGGCIEGWNKGVDLQSNGGNKSNANSFFGTKLRVCYMGIKMTDIDNLELYGVINEGCEIGIAHESGQLVSFGSHFENNVGVKWQIHTTGAGSISSFGDMFYQGGADLAIYIESGAGRHYFASTILNFGIKHNGTGVVTLVSPVNAVTVTGTGPISQINSNGIQGLQGMTGQALSLSGFAYIATALNIINAAGAGKIGGLNGVQFTDQNSNVKANVNSAGVMFPQQTTAGIYSGAGSPEGVVVAAIGSIYLRTNGGAATSFYVKESGASNTGWIAK